MLKIPTDEGVRQAPGVSPEYEIQSGLIDCKAHVEVILRSTRSLFLSLAFSTLGLFCSGGSGQAAVSGGLTMVSGNGQVVAEFFRTETPMVVRATDASGNPVANLPVTWKITKGEGTLGGSDAKTDANELATTAFVATVVGSGQSFSQQTITATTSLGSVDFLITTVLSRLPNGQSASMPAAPLLLPTQENPTVTGQAGCYHSGRR